ncbi:MAG: isoprenylcysteine carboxylmethyltransferase family protein [Rhodospirillales bacterium]|nr:isoprenylcysteine carboxylmethyltransferase family protein [Rhodospirillales bacterium]
METEEIRRLAAKSAFRLVVTAAVMVATLLVAAGTVHWPAAWACAGLWAAMTATGVFFMLRINPELAVERMQGRTGTKGWDKLLMPLLALILPLAILVVAGLDARFGWTGTFPPWPRWIGAVLMLSGYGLGVWAMASNPFFSAVVRIQTDRGHRVADGGPYAVVRHPGYVGAFGVNIGPPLILGSVWALTVVAVLLALFVLRTALEDRTLHAELEGYADYAARVRWRLFPGLW